MAALARCNLKNVKYIFNPKSKITRLISTSGNKRETTVIDSSQVTCAPKNETKENWISYGFSRSEKQEDRQAMHIVMFSTITIALVCGGFIFAYLPDFQMRDWTRREGFLELRRREENNLPLVDPNLIDPSKISLPSDEELEDREIII